MGDDILKKKLSIYLLVLLIISYIVYEGVPYVYNNYIIYNFINHYRK